MTSIQAATLYGTEACHLCELAEELVQQALVERPWWRCQTVDISDSDALFERYGVLIPVLALEDGRELCWPFTAQALAEFLGQPTA